MASLSGWTTENPANTSVWSQIDDQYRSDKSVERNVWEEEHYWDSGSAGSTGLHKPGSLRPYYGPRSEVSQVGDNLRLMWVSDSSELIDVSHASAPFYLHQNEPIVVRPTLSSATTGAVLIGSVALLSHAQAGLGRMVGAADYRVISHMTEEDSFLTAYSHWFQNFDAYAGLATAIRISGGNIAEGGSKVSSHGLSTYTASMSSVT